MIKANELRIGNILEYNDNGERFEVLEISELGISVKSEREITWMEFDNFSPIPLTEEILLKCGFRENIKYKNAFYLHYEVLNGAKILDIDISAKVLIFDSVEININHLHQLQNIYFALTGEELNIQL